MHISKASSDEHWRVTVVIVTMMKAAATMAMR